MQEPWASISTTILGGGFTLVLTYILGLRKDKREYQLRVDDYKLKAERQEVDIAIVVEEMGAKLRAELNAQNDMLRKENTQLRDTVRTMDERLQVNEVWRAAYLDIYPRLTYSHSQYSLLLAYVNTLKAWAKENQVTFNVPEPPLDPLPAVPPLVSISMYNAKD